jgi:SAM-dependent methyltransferase
MHDSSPSPWVRRFASLIVTGGRVLDVASGAGRHARLLAQMGYRVEAVDRDPVALEQLTGEPTIQTRVTDLESDVWPYPTGSFDGVIVTNYLHRPLFTALLQALRPNGVLIYETFMAGNERFGKPSNPDFLLQSNELFDRLNGHLTVVAFEQGVLEAPKPACVQRVCAVAAVAGRIPWSP